MRRIKKDGINTIVYSHHNFIKVSINWTTGYAREPSGRNSKIMITNGYRNYREHLCYDNARIFSESFIYSLMKR